MQSPVGGRSKMTTTVPVCTAGQLLPQRELALATLARPGGPMPHAARIVQLLRHATGVGAGLLDLGPSGGLTVHAATERERARFAAAWRTPEGAGSLVLSDPATGAPLGVAIATPVRVGNESGFLALIEPDTSTILPRHGALLALIGELSATWSDAPPPTSAREAEARLQARNAFLESAGALAGIGTLEGELAGGRIVASTRACEILRTPSVESIEGLLDLVAPPDRLPLRRMLYGEGGDGQHSLMLTLAPSGALAGLRVTHDACAGGPPRFIATVEDATDDMRRLHALSGLCERDPVTGLLNRNALTRTFAAAHCEALGSATFVGTLLVSVKDLRNINEMYGTAVGDEVLRSIAKLLASHRQPDDWVLRVASCEFAFVLCGAEAEAVLTKRVERIRQALAKTLAVGSHRIEIETRYGLAIHPVDTQDGSIDLFSAASYALNDAMRRPRGTIRRYRPSYREQRERERQLIDDVRTALGRGEFAPFFQPKIDLETGTIVGFEALCRWCHPVRGVLTPGAFYQALTSPLVSGELSDVSLVGAFAAAALWRRRGLMFGHISINLSATQLARTDLVAFVEALQAHHGVPASNIGFEVLENVLIGDNQVVQSNLRRLAERGFTIALDDFGTGFASLSQVRESYIGEVKIDRSFVTHAGSSARDQQIVGAIVLMARRLGLKTVAEGIEDEETLRKLRAMGCSTGQGFVFAQALPFAEATEFLGRQSRIYTMLGGPPAP